MFRLHTNEQRRVLFTRAGLPPVSTGLLCFYLSSQCLQCAVNVVFAAVISLIVGYHDLSARRAQLALL